MSERDADVSGTSARSATASMRESLRAGRRFYAAPSGQPRVRRATDIVVLGASLLALAGTIAAQPPGSFEQAALRFVEAFPDWLRPVWGFLIGLIALWSVVMLVAPLFSGRWRITVEALLAIVLAALLCLVAARLATGNWPGAEATSGLTDGLRFPSARIGIAAAVIAVVNAHLARPFSSTGRRLLLLGAVAAVFNGDTTIAGAIAAILIGVAAGGAIRLALGTSAGRPSIEDVSAALEGLGVAAHDLQPSERQLAGVVLVYAKDSSGGDLAIKVYGRDAYDNQLLAKAWRTLWYRDGGPAGGLTRSYPAEREALLTLLAGNAGVPTSDVLTAGTTASDDSLLVLRVHGRLFESLTAAEVDDELLGRCWKAVVGLGEAHIAHRQITPAALRVADGAVTLVDLGAGTVSPNSDERLTDRAQLLATTATVVGVERAVRAAVAAIGVEGVRALLPYIQQTAFNGTLRRALKLAEIDVDDDLRAEAAKAADTTVPELVQLRRVTWGTLIQLGLLIFAAAAVLSFVGGVDFGELREDLEGASWGWIIAGAIVAQLPRLTQAVSTLGATPVRLPFGPVYVMQLATSYMNLALPSSVGRMAVSIRFFQRQGVGPAIAVTSGVIDSFTNTIVQVVLLVLLLTFSSATLTLDFSVPSSSGLTDLLILLIALLVAVILAVVLLPVGRRAIGAVRERIRQWWPEVRGTFRSLRGSHKLGELVLGNMATEVLFATSLGLFARGLGFPLSLAELLVINMSVSLFATFIPVPGGIGVVEGGLLVGLTSAGIPESAAFAIVMLYRITTFYLPPIWGWFALHWLRRNRYL